MPGPKYIKFRGATYRLADMPTYEQQDELDAEAAEAAQSRQRRRDTRRKEAPQRVVEKSGKVDGFPFIIEYFDPPPAYGGHGMRMGYVGVPKAHPLYGVDQQDEIDYDKLGLPAPDEEDRWFNNIASLLNITYADDGSDIPTIPNIPGTWWFGRYWDLSSSGRPTIADVSKYIQELARKLKSLSTPKR